MKDCKTLLISETPLNSGIFQIHLNRPSHRNALTLDFFVEFPAALSSLDEDPNCKVIILSGAGDHFCSGIDLNAFNSITGKFAAGDRGRIGEKFRREIKFLQNAISALEKCRKVVIASIHGGCIGGGIDLVSACDIRFCDSEAFFSVKEVDLAIIADLGTIQRLPLIVGFGNAMELALTGRVFKGLEAKEMGLVSRVFRSKEELHEGARLVAQGIAAKSPLAVTGTKEVMLRSREMSVEQGLDYVATWNSSMLISQDLTEAVSAYLQKRKPVFSKL